METKTTITLLIVIALVMSFSALLLSMNQHLSEGKIEFSDSDRDNAFYMTNEEMEDTFMIGCVGEDSSMEDYCQCCFRYISAKKTDKQLANMIMDWYQMDDDEEVPELFIEAVVNCLDRY